MPYVLVRTRLGGPAGEKTVQMLLDTGATMCAVRPSVLAGIGIDAAAATQRYEIATVSGLEYPALTVVDLFSAFGHRRENMRVLALDLPRRAMFDGIIGLDFLRGHRLLLDFREGIIEFD